MHQAVFVLNLVWQHLFFVYNWINSSLRKFAICPILFFEQLITKTNKLEEKILNTICFHHEYIGVFLKDAQAYTSVLFNCASTHNITVLT
jgi:hypothetical protein